MDSYNALVPFIGKRKSKRSSTSRNLGKYSFMGTVPMDYSMTNQRRYGTAGNSIGSSSRRGGYRRSKFDKLNTSTNPIYPRPEVKWTDTSFPTTTIANAGTIIGNLNVLSPGTGPQSRIGNQVATKSCYYQLFFQAPTGSPPVGVRYILYWDRQPNGTSAVVSDILVNNGVSQYITAPMNLDNRDRFVILADTRITMSPEGETAKIVEDFRSINQLTTYTTSTNVPYTGALGFLIVSDETADVTNPSFSGTFRVRYMDN